MERSEAARSLSIDYQLPRPYPIRARFVRTILVMLHDVLMMGLGAVLVSLGVIAGSIADRIRGHRRAAATARDRATTAAPRRARAELAMHPDVTPVPQLAEVREALTSMGYKRATADAAAAEARRRIGDGAPLQTWIREALRVIPNPAKS